MVGNERTVIDISRDAAIRLSCFLSANIPNKDQLGIRNKRVTKIKKFKFDTGAQYTCLNAREFSINITEEEFRKTYKGNIMEGTGLDQTTHITYYLLQVENFVVEGLDLGSVPIYITFDSRACKNLLGLDLIKLFNVQMDFDNGQMKLSKTQNFLNFKKSKLKLELVDMFRLGIYRKNSEENDDIQDMA